MKLTSTKDQALTKIKALVHSDSGMGKTTSLKTLPKDRTIIANAERGVIPLRNEDYPVLSIANWQDVRDLVVLFLNPEAESSKPFAADVEGKDVLVLDSLSRVSSMCMQHIVTVDRRVLVAERTGGKRETPESVYAEQMTQEDWGLYRTRMGNLVAVLCGLPMHIVVTSLSAWSKDKNGGATYRTPNMAGKFAQEVPSLFDLVLHMESQGTGSEETRVWRTFNDGETIAKDASGVLDQYEPADWSKMFAKILTGEKK